MKVDFNFNEYILQMSDERLVKFSQDSGTTPNYIKRHLIYKKKIPRPEMIDALVFASSSWRHTPFRNDKDAVASAAMTFMATYAI